MKVPGGGQTQIPDYIGNPNGVLNGNCGDIVKDPLHGALYFKTTPNGTLTGWTDLVGGAGGGESIWEDNEGVISLVDYPTLVQIGATGTIFNGEDALAFWDDDTMAIVSYRTTSNGFYVGSVDSEDGNVFSELILSTSTVQTLLNFRTFGASYGFEIRQQTNESGASINLMNQGTSYAIIDPWAAITDPILSVNSGFAHTEGNLVEIKNDSISIFRITVAGSDNYTITQSGSSSVIQSAQSDGVCYSQAYDSGNGASEMGVEANGPYLTFKDNIGTTLTYFKPFLSSSPFSFATPNSNSVGGNSAFADFVNASLNVRSVLGAGNDDHAFNSLGATHVINCAYAAHEEESNDASPVFTFTNTPASGRYREVSLIYHNTNAGSQTPSFTGATFATAPSAVAAGGYASYFFRIWNLSGTTKIIGVQL